MPSFVKTPMHSGGFRGGCKPTYTASMDERPTRRWYDFTLPRVLVPLLIVEACLFVLAHCRWFGLLKSKDEAELWGLAFFSGLLALAQHGQNVAAGGGQHGRAVRAPALGWRCGWPVAGVPPKTEPRTEPKTEPEFNTFLRRRRENPQETRRFRGH